MATAQTTTTDESTRLQLAEEPTTDKQEAIVEVALENPDASHGEIADLVEEEFGIETDASWVSRVRKKHIEEVEAEPEPETGGADAGASEVLTRVQAIEDAIDDLAEEDDLDGLADQDDVDRAIDAIDDVADTVDVLVDHVTDMNDRLRRVERIVEDDLTDELVADLLRSRVDDLADGDAAEAGR